jgi:cell division protein FtsQ
VPPPAPPLVEDEELAPSEPLLAVDGDADDSSPPAAAVPVADIPEAPGAGRRLLERAKRWASTASAVLLLAGSIGGGRAAHRWITHTPRFGAREIEVEGIVRTRRDEVLAAARLQPGTNVLGFDTVRAERELEELPWIARARVTRRLPGHVRIAVEERTAVAIVSAGGLYLSAHEGTLFKRVQGEDPSDLPLITGVRREDFERDPDAARENVRDALALLADVGASSLGNRVRVEEVHREPTGDLSLVLADGGVYVWLGRGPYRAKLSRLSAILSELERQRIAPAEIHLESDRHPERATVRVRVPDAEPEPAPSPPTAAPVAAPASRAASHRAPPRTRHRDAPSTRPHRRH